MRIRFRERIRVRDILRVMFRVTSGPRLKLGLALG